MKFITPAHITSHHLMTCNIISELYDIISQCTITSARMIATRVLLSRTTNLFRLSRLQANLSTDTSNGLKMSKTELASFFAAGFPQISSSYVIERVTPSDVVMRLRVQHGHLRPGGTVSGPAMFTLADALMYTTILSKIGPKALAVTTNCSIDFLRKPEAGKDLLARCQILKLGKVLVVGDVLVYSACTDDSSLPEGRPFEGFVELDKPVCRATMTYSIPK